jgi:histidine triad (HIT) family protein
LGYLSCIFCDIIARRLPLIDIYEDDNFLVLLDKYPISRGHTLVIPKKHYDNLLVMPVNEIGKLYSLVPIIAKATILAVKAKGFNVGQNNGRAANQIIPHVHVHIIPRFGYGSTDDKWPVRQIISREELSKVADLIKPLLKVSMVDGG